MEISSALWASWLGKDFTFFTMLLYHEKKFKNIICTEQSTEWLSSEVVKLLTTHATQQSITLLLYWCMSAATTDEGNDDDDDDGGCSTDGRTVTSFGNRTTSWLTNFSTGLSRTFTTISATAAATTHTTDMIQFSPAQNTAQISRCLCCLSKLKYSPSCIKCRSTGSPAKSAMVLICVKCAYGTLYALAKVPSIQNLVKKN